MRIPGAILAILLISSRGLSQGEATPVDGSPAAFVRVGEGTYSAAEKPAALELPPRDVFVTSDWVRPLPSNEWYTSIVRTRFSDPLFVHPLSAQVVKTGLEVGLPDQVVKRFEDGDVEISRPHRADFVVQPREFAPKDARLSHAGDWTVTFRLARRESAVDVTLAKGSPFIWFEPKGTALTVDFLENEPEVVLTAPDRSAVLIRVGTHNYGFFSPPGSSYPALAGRRLNIPSTKVESPLVVACLPDSSVETFDAFARSAPSRPVDSRVAWKYDAASSQVHTTFELQDRPLWGRPAKAMLGLYPHQWRHLDPAFKLSAITYPTIRGPLRLLIGNRFETTMTYSGILPWLPEVDPADADALRRLVSEFKDQGEAYPVPFIRQGLDGPSGGYTSYWVGKNLQRVANLIPIARQVGEPRTSTRLLQVVKSNLEWWFRAEKYGKDGQLVGDNLFLFDRLWGALIGVGASHGSDNELNDHHLQLGYWIYSAAIVALHDPEWARQERWGGMVELLIRDIASPSRVDPLFPFLRCFSPYEGHSWASGCGASEHGPNQESSSEAVNAWVGVILWGQATGNPELTALGVYLYTTETESIHNYWFDDHGDVFDRECPEPYAAMVWGSKYAHQTWWTEDPNSIHGINILPVTGGSFHLGRSPQMVLRLHEKARSEWDAYVRTRTEKQATSNTHPDNWMGLLLSHLALADPPRAYDLWQRSQGRVPDDVSVEFGESKAHTLHWLSNLKSLGPPEAGVRADVPLFQAFARGGKRSYVVYNADAAARQVRFTDGTVFTVPPGSLVRHPPGPPGR